ncbi:MAG TPA: NAD(P)/FAD-dependent oxidoreductase [Opitutaceae bacterium]|nr:NAD(P)/FAD-dependent oxidoreductase [Opitutaceae bacterium]
MLQTPRMTNGTYDILVIGGGPAGSTAAALARKHGLKVAVVEKEKFPRFKIGESLLPNGNALMRETGVWPKIEQAGFVKKFGAYFFLPSGDLQKEVIFSDGLVRGLENTFQVERATFDKILLDHAAELGAHVFENTAAKSVRADGDVSHVTLSHNGAERTVSARWILDGSGRENVFSCDLKRKFDAPRLEKRIAVYTHFSGVPRAEGKAAGHTIVIRLKRGWFWVIPVSEEHTSVGLVTEVDDLKGLAPAEAFQRAVDDTPRLKEWLRNAERVMEFKVTSDYSYFREELARDRLILLGDSAGFFDPIFSSGVYVAMYSAKRAIEMVLAADAAQRPLTRSECVRYTKRIKQNARVFEKLIHAFYDNDSFAIFMSTNPPFRIDRGINSIVAGYSEINFAIWWRLQFFLVVCRLQKYFRLTPPIAFSPANS